MAKLHVKKGDKVLVLSGKDKGKEGKVISALPAEGKVIVEGVNIVKKHTRAQQRVQAGIHEQEAPIYSDKVMVVCPSCKKASRIKKNVAADGSRNRACRKCGESLDK
ncbi:ribosomal protein L24 [Dethiobacter alkaliphilus AHT 1]|uniref:Large ribosomal subunit protein uL24 n=1 Tax=Dethiobacter alkaliphilus AHT 1 TaxID=555088 RepID=C0GGA3_DETAL|nr:ribosomal protein L24 [Dethiobacter alkaliphilus AHT 1]MCW3491094.1 50S ribosomal protein L24 [Dethiobacter alkaliphilus]